MLAVTSDYTFAAGNVVLSLIKQRPQKDFDINIFYEDMLPEDKKIFEDTGICHLIQYRCPDEFEAIIRHNCPKFNDPTFAKHFCFLKFAKFEIFDLLNRYHHVVWLDADISVQGDPSDIVKSEPFAIAIDRGWTVQNNFTAPIEGYDMDRQGMCSAVFMVSDKMERYPEMRQWCYDKAAEVCPYFKNIDQGVINILLQEFDIEYQLLPLDDYLCFTDRSDAYMAKVVHFGTKVKVWNHTEIAASFPEWYRIHLQWISLGGSDFPRPDGFCVVNVYQKLIDRNKEIKKWRDRAIDYEKTLRTLQKLPKSAPEIGYKIKVLGIPLFRKKVIGSVVKYYLFGIRFTTVRTVEK